MSLVPRERLSATIREATQRGIAFVTAPAGYGKTEAILDAHGDNLILVEFPFAVVDSIEGIAMRRCCKRTQPFRKYCL